ncbi:MAG: TonB-dependent receptor [Verrucomicrobia bacterium]|nr:TonB-dependent receptor [Verrucomicrobiota bacterium]
MNSHPRSVPTATARFLRAVVAFMGLALTSLAFAQGVVSSGITGMVRDNTGKAVAGATLTATHTPTGTGYDAISSETGRYNFRGLIVGGPYTIAVTAPGFKSVERTDVNTALGQDIDLNINLEASSVVVMDKFTVKGDTLALDSNAAGAASLLTRERLLLQPTSQRSFADIARTNTLATLRNVFGDRQEGMITAAGMNNRFNSVMLDGARINDQFGLNASGLQSFFNPLSLETVEQFSIAVSPYDVRQSGFTGAAVNAVTRSGTNEFHGSIYTYYTDGKYAGKDLVGSLAGQEPLDTRKTWGATLGGPILKNRLFFFANYEKFHREQVAPTPNLTAAAGDVTAVNNALAAIKSASGKTFDSGSLGGAGTLETEEEKKLYKVDWNIIKGHRLSVRYNETVGTLPQFGRIATGSFTGILGGAGPVATAGTAFSSNYYTQIRTEKVYAGTLNNQWSQNFKTEFKYAKTSYEQLTSSPSTLPEIRIFGVSGVNGAGATVTNSGVLVLGTEQFRHGNVIRVETKSYSANADYFWKNYTFTAGFDREKSDFYNLFRQSSYGLFDYASPAAFAADTPSAYTRAFYVQGTPAADISGFTDLGVFVQAKLDVNSRLNLIAGLRQDYISSPSRPPLNQNFVNTFGIRNDGSVDGTTTVSPRLSFNWAVDDDRLMQMRGGFGHFSGRAPWVFISNAYGNTGVGRFSVLQSGAAAPKLANYLRSNFDTANPVGVAAVDGDPNARREVNLLQDGLKLPSVWRANLALDRKIPSLGLTVSAEAVFTDNNKAFFADQMNIKPLVATATTGPAIGLDGRQRFNGGANSAGATSLAFGNVIRVRNIGRGDSQYYTLSVDRPMKNHWAANASYTHGHSIEAQAFGQTVGVNAWDRNASFNPNAIEMGRSDFEIRHRVQLSVSRQFEFVKGWPTKASLYYEGHSGNPFSYAYATDVNGDGVAGNDLVYVPTGPNDPKVDLSGMTGAQQTAYFQFLDNSGLVKFAGGPAARNGFIQPWINQLDLRFTQKVPVYKPVELELFLDFSNFGFWLSRKWFGDVRLLTATSSNAVFYRRLMTAQATPYNAAGQIRPTYTAEPAAATIDNVASRWRIQFGATLRF